MSSELPKKKPPQELPGFYYDSEKKRYFPLKGPIPGSSSHSQRPSKPHTQENSQPSTPKRKETKTAKLLQLRELYGKVLTTESSKCNFHHEYQKKQASQPMVWKYRNMERDADGALEHLHIDVQTPEGQNKRNFLLTGCTRGYLSLYELMHIGKHLDCECEGVPEPVWPSITDYQAVRLKALPHIRMPGNLIVMPSRITSIKAAGKCRQRTDDVGSSFQHAVISTLGSELSGGTVSIMKLNEPLDYSMRNTIMVATLNCSIWTAECHPDGSQAVIGTNRGAALLDLETGTVSWLCHSTSDVLSQQFNQSGNTILCGYRNGAIVTVDVRQKPQGFRATVSRHPIPFSSNTGQMGSSRSYKQQSKRWFKIKGSFHPSCTVFMPSSISSLVALQTDDQYFLGSSMDGLIKLYDHRLIQRGAIQSYEGHVNSHTRIQLGVDPSERLLMSGGEDGKVRIWSIKTGELLVAAKISNSAPTIMCWPRTEMVDETSIWHNPEDIWYKQNHSWGAWLGSTDGLFHIHD